MRTKIVSLLLALALCGACQAKEQHGPDCSGGWPTSMAQGLLKNAGLLKNEEIDFARTKTVQLASEKIGSDLWHQVYLVTFFKKSGETIRAIAVHDASKEECSITGVTLYVISDKLK
jgi:hypothetical protein